MTLLLSLCMAAPLSLALGNHASVVVGADDSAAAICQVFVLVHSLVILAPEDSLALVTPRASAPLDSRLGALSIEEGSVANCSSVIDVLRIHVPAASGVEAASFVSGASLAPEPHVEVLGENSDAAVCQVAFLFDSIVIGGGAFGFPVGESAGLVTIASVTDGGAAECEAAIREVEIEEGA